MNQLKYIISFHRNCISFIFIAVASPSKAAAPLVFCKLENGDIFYIIGNTELLSHMMKNVFCMYNLVNSTVVKLRLAAILPLTAVLLISCSLQPENKPPRLNNKLALHTLLLASCSDLPVPDIGTPYKDVLDILDKHQTKIVEITEDMIKVESQRKNWQSGQLETVGTFTYLFENGALSSGPNFHNPDNNPPNNNLPNNDPPNNNPLNNTHLHNKEDK